jgi:hypothetical protein
MRAFNRRISQVPSWHIDSLVYHLIYNWLWKALWKPPEWNLGHMWHSLYWFFPLVGSMWETLRIF